MREWNVKETILLCSKLPTDKIPPSIVRPAFDLVCKPPRVLLTRLRDGGHTPHNTPQKQGKPHRSPTGFSVCHRPPGPVEVVYRDGEPAFLAGPQHLDQPCSPPA